MKNTYTGKLDFSNDGDYLLHAPDYEFNLSKALSNLIGKTVDIKIIAGHGKQVLFDGVGTLNKSNYGGYLHKYDLDEKYCFDDILWNFVGQEIILELEKIER